MTRPSFVLAGGLLMVAAAVGAGDPAPGTARAAEDPRLATILERHSPVLRDVYANVATPYRIKGRSAVGYYLGNGDATVTARDAKGQWTFIVSPLAYYHGDTTKDKGAAAGWSGQIDLRIPELADCADYQMTLDLYRGELRGRFTGKTGTVVMRTHVVRDTNFLITSIENLGPGTVSAAVELSTGKPYNEFAASSGGAKGDMAYVARNGRETENPLSVVCHTTLGSRIVGAESAAVSDEPYKAKLRPVNVKPGATVHVVSSYEVSAVFPPDYGMPAIQSMVANRTGDAVTPVLQRLEGQTPPAAAALIESNARWWGAFWARSHIDIPGEPLVEKQWYGRLYLAGCMCREGSFPPGLYAWIDGEKPAWGSDYHWNFNTAFAFNGLSAANHPDLVKPFCDLVVAQTPLARQVATELGEPGLHFGTATTPYGWMHRGDFGMRHNAADAAMNMITWYRLTRDEAWMRDKLYPFLKEIAANSAGFLIRDGERTVVSSCVAEFDCNHRINATQAIAFTGRVFRTLLDLSKELGVDGNLRPIWQDTLDRLSPVPLVMADGLRCLSFSEDDPGVTANGAPYPLQAFYPALWFNIDSPEALYARNMIQYFYQHGEIGKTDVFRAHFFTWLVPQAIRCGYPAEEVLKVIRSVVEKTMLPNFTYWDQALGTEHQVIDGIGAMFLQSVHGRLIVFPNWTMATDAAFHQLREEGAFLVSAAVKKGVIGPVTITSEKGLACRVENPWPGRGVQVETDGKAVAATRNADDTYSFATQPGGTYTLQPHGEAMIYRRPPPPLRPDDPPARIIADENFADDFSSGRDHWLIDQNNCWKVEEGAFCLNNRKYGRAFASLKNRVWHDATYEFDVAIQTGGIAEAHFRKARPFEWWNNRVTAGYRLEITPQGGLTLGVGKETLASVKTGKSFTTLRRVKIVNRGPSIRLYLDDDPKPVIDVESKHCTEGQFVFSGNSVDARFDNLRITTFGNAAEKAPSEQKKSER
jgi:hypothetical protein